MAVRQAAFFKVLLMIFFGTPKLPGGNDLGHNRARKPALRGVAGGLGFGFLLWRMEKNRRAVLSSVIWTLPVQSRGIVIFPKDFEQIAVGNDLGIEGDFDRLGMTRAVAADSFIAGIFQRSASVAHLRGFHAGELPERRLHAPKASRGESSFLQSFHDSIVPFPDGRAGFSLQPGLEPTLRRKPWRAGFSPREALASLPASGTEVPHRSFYISCGRVGQYGDTGFSL
jgi:hypothetical protein